MTIISRYIITLIFLIALALLWPRPAHAQEPVIILDEQVSYAIKGTQIAYLEDPTGQLTFEQITSPQWADSFKVYQGDIPRFAHTDSVYWFRLNLLNQTAQTDWRLEVMNTGLEYVDIYQMVGTTLSQQQAGTHRPITVKRVPYNYPVFIVNLSQPTPQTIYLRVQSKTTLSLPLTISSNLQFTAQSQSNMLKLGLVLGILFIMVGYNSFLFVSLRDESYLYYSLFTFSLLLNHVCSSGLGDRYLWSLHPEIWGFILRPISGTCVVLFMLQFTRSFLSTPKTAPRLDQVLWYLVLSLGLILVAPFSSIGLELIGSIFVPLITIMAFIAVLVTGVVVWWHNYRPARYFLLAWTLFILAVLIFFLQIIKVLPFIMFAADLIYIGSVVLVLILSLALADRINLLQADTAQANQKLHESENRLKQFLEALPVGVVVFRANQFLSYINERAYELFELTPTAQDNNVSLIEAYAVIPLYIAQTDQRYPVEKMPMRRAFKGHNTYIDDLEIQTTSQQRRQLEVWGKPIFDAFGKVEYAMSVFQDITLRKQNEAELYHYQHRLEELVANRTQELNRVNAELDRLAHLDGLTHIANRRRFDQYLAQAWQDMAQAQLSLSLILCDIDYFKLYNDRYGHQAGDDCLQQVAQAFTASIKRSTDLAARYGGEEFVLVLPRTDEAGVKIVAGYLHERIQQLQIPHAASQCSQYITVSLGVTTIIPTLDRAPETLLAAADSALYQAKLQGRNRTVYQAVG